jgi:hypothetical protein
MTHRRIVPAPFLLLEPVNNVSNRQGFTQGFYLNEDNRTTTSYNNT